MLSDISLRKLEIRLMQDELRLQGEFLVFIIYLSEEQKMDWLEQTVLFEGKLECSGIEEGMYDYINYALEDTLADVRLLDAQHQRQKLEKNTQRKAASKPATSNRFNNFHQRQYDFNEYEKKLLNQ